MAVSGPTQGAARHTESVARWKAHPRLAQLLRAIVLALPIVVAVGLTWGAGRVLPPEKLGIGRWTWIVGAFVVCNAALIWMGKLTRRLTPLIALMKLSLVFPDQAPSRAKATLRKSNSRKLLREMEEARARGETTGPAAHGEYIVQLLHDLNEHDRLTRGHSERVRAYAEMLGEELELSSDDMDKLRWAALLHDAGKLDVPSHILNKDGRPTNKEWEVMQGHPTAGGKYLEPLRPWLGDWVHAADQHHLRWDGNGYPLDLAGTDIAFAGRLVAIADSYDVMTSPRSYKEPLSAEVARQELTSCAGSQFDPQMVRAFLNIGLGRLRAVAGPLAWIANFVGSTQVPVPVASTAITTAGTGAAAAAAVAMAAITGAIGGDSTPPQAERVVEEVTVSGVQVEDVDVTAFEDEPVTIVLVGAGEGTITFDVGGASHGQVVMGSVESALAAAALESSRAEVTYVPEADYHGEDSFAFEACDQTGECSTATVLISIVPSNDAPVAREDRGTTEAGTAVTIDVVGNDSDVDGDELRLTEVYRTDHGDVSIVDGEIEFVADDGYEGSVRIDYAVTDPGGARAIGTAIIEVTAADEVPTPTTTAPATRTTTPTTTTPASTTTRPSRPTTTTTTTTTAPVIDDPPVGIDDSASVNEDGAIWIDVLANDSDPENSPLNLTGVGAPLHGTAVIGFGQVYYTPTPDYAGGDAFTYTMSDGTNPSVTATVSVTVTPENDDPVATAPDATVAEDTALGGAVLSVTATDADPTDTLVYAIASGNPGPKFAIDGDGRVTVIAALDHESTAAYTLGLTVSDGTVVVPLTVTVTVGDVDESPVVTDDGAGTSEDIPAAFDIGFNDSDPEGGSLTFNVPATTTAGGTLAETGGIVTYTPPGDWSGSDSFSYTAADPGGNLSTPATVTIVVTAVNDAPVAGDDTGVGFTTAEDTLLTTADVTANDTDVDNPVDPASITVVTPPATGTLTDNGDGTFDFDPALNWSGTETFTYTITDAGALPSNTATVTIVVTAANDAPAAADDGGFGFTTVEDTLLTTGDVTTNDTDVDHAVEPTSVTVVTTPTDGTLTDNGNGTFDYDPDPDFNGTDTFTYTITDPATATSNTATVTLTITPVNDAPGFTAGADPSVLEDAWAQTVAGWASAISAGPADESGQSLTFNVVSNSNPGLFAAAPAIDDVSGDLTFTPAAATSGTADVEFTLSDDGGTANGGDDTSPSVTVQFTVTPIVEVVLSEFRASGPGGNADEFIEVFNAGSSSVDLTDWNFGVTGFLNYDFYSFPSVSISPGRHFLVAHTGSPLAGTADDTWSGLSYGTWGDVVLKDGSGTHIDIIGFDSGSNPILWEGTKLPSYPGGFSDRSYERLAGGASGNCTDTDDNLADWVFAAVATPRTMSDPAIPCDDFDAVAAGVDNCPAVFNVDQFDTDGDGRGDACDATPTVASSAIFTTTGQAIGNVATSFVAVGDLDGDGDLDATFANDGNANTVWFNDGSGTFTDSGQNLGSNQSVGAAIADLDNDGDLDIVYAHDNYSPNTVWLNDGTGTFTDSGQTLGAAWSEDVVVGDVDGDGDLDLVFAENGVANTLWLNDGTGTFTDSGQNLDTGPTEGLAIGDLDGDGDLDLISANWSSAGRVWTNDGTGTFTNSGQALGSAGNMAVELGDLDGDGDLDAVFAADNDPSTIWRNDGTGIFTDTGDPIPSGRYLDMALGDLDGDGDLDVTAGAHIGANSLHINDGTGAFSAGQVLSTDQVEAVASGDLDGDGDLDTITANAGSTKPNTVWLNQPSPGSMVVSEWSSVGGYAGNDFVELFNASGGSIDIEGWTLEIADDTTIVQTVTLTGSSTLIPAGGHYLIAESGSRDQDLSPPLPAGPGIRLRSGPTVVDTVGTRERTFGTAVPASLWAEGTGVAPLMDAAGIDQSWEREAAGADGNCQDTDDNSADFVRNFDAADVNPQHSGDPATPCTIPVAPTAPAHLVISEFRTDGPAGGGDEIVEIFNPTGAPISLAGHELRNEADAVLYAYPSVTLQPGEHYLTGGASYSGPVDALHGAGFTNGSAAKLYDTGTFMVVDDVDVGPSAPALPTLDGQLDQSYERRFDGCQDTDIWRDDFLHQLLPTPMTISDPATPCA